MSKPLLGLLLGSILGALDGLSSLLAGPEVAPQLMGIMIGSTIKGLLAGMAIGFFSRKVPSLPAGLVFGFGVGLFLAFLVALIPDPATGGHHYLEIMIPGSIVGLILGYATQKYGRSGTRTGMA